MEGEAPVMFLQNVFYLVLLISNSYDYIWDILLLKIPRDGGAEKLNPQEAIPPFSLMEDSIHGKRAETLVKTA